MIPVANPYIGDREEDEIIRTIRSGWVSSSSSTVSEFESIFCLYTGRTHAISASSGTTALHLALLANDIGPGDEVIVPSLTFVAPVNAVCYTGAIPVFADVSADTWCIDPEEVLKCFTSRTKAVIAVDLYGHPCELNRLQEICSEREILLIEDAAESLGATIGLAQPSQFADIAVYSFYGNKIITTGEGGMAVTDDDNLAERMLHLRRHAMDEGGDYWHTEIGFNYRLSALPAALGIAQMSRIEELVKKKQDIHHAYETALESCEFLSLQGVAEGVVPSHWLNAVQLSPSAHHFRRDLVRGLARRGIQTRIVFPPVHTMPPYRKYPRQKLTNTTLISKSSLCMPSGPNIETDQVAYCANSLTVEANFLVQSGGTSPISK